jgi:HPt (histidine-containing phosphotransfer) domain-containing protein
MGDEEEMRLKMIAIGVRYLARTATEIGDLQKMVAQLKAADPVTLRELEVLAHRIRGSGAVFGFARLSDAAGAIEMLALKCLQEQNYDAASVAAKFTAYIASLASETHQAQTAASA